MRKWIRLISILALLVFFGWILTRKDSENSSEIIPNPNLPNEIPNNSALESSDSFYKNFLHSIQESNRLYRNEKDAVHFFRSNYKCLGRQNMANAREGRSCVFENICYHTVSKKYIYYLPSREPVFYDYEKGPMYEFPKKFIELNALHIFHSGQSFTPTIQIQRTKPSDAIWLKDLHVLWSNWATEFNFGHLVFEELGSIYIDMARLGIQEKNPQLLNFRNSVNASHPRYRKFTEFFGKVLSRKPLVREQEYYRKFQKEYICFSEFMVSSPTRLFLDFTDVTNLGKETIWKAFRDKVLQVHGMDPSLKPKKIQLTFLKKGTTDKPNKDGNRSRFRDISNLDELVAFAKKRYPKIMIHVLDPSKLSLKEQLRIIQETSILVTPNGGVSMIAAFLPEKSHAIIMDYYVSSHPIYNSYIPYKVGNSGSMEISFWNLFPHFTKQYYQILDPSQDMEWDTRYSTNSRDDASILVDLDRFEYMVNHALLQIH